MHICMFFNLNTKIVFIFEPLQKPIFIGSYALGSFARMHACLRENICACNDNDIPHCAVLIFMRMLLCQMNHNVTSSMN